MGTAWSGRLCRRLLGRSGQADVWPNHNQGLGSLGIAFVGIFGLMVLLVGVAAARPERGS